MSDSPTRDLTETTAKTTRIGRWSLGLSVVLVAYWTALVLGTHLPADRLPKNLSLVDKTLHFAAYSGLTALVVAWFSARSSPTASSRGPTEPISARRNRMARLLVWIVVLLIVHAAIDEMTQGWVPGRFPSWLDWFADCLGILAVAIIAWPYLTGSSQQSL